MNDLLAAYYRDELATPLLYWVKHLSEQKRESLHRSTIRVLSGWKARQPPEPAQTTERSAQLATYQSLESVARKVPPIISYSPIGYTGTGANDIDLAFKLWTDGDPAFAKIVRVYGLPAVLAMIGLTASATLHSRIRLNGFLVRFLIHDKERQYDFNNALVRHIETDRRKKEGNLAAARFASAEKRRQEAINNERCCRVAAKEYAINNYPMPSKPQIVAYLLTLGFAQTTRDGKKKPLKASTISRLIARVMEDARKAPKLKRSLYATDHTRNG